MRLPHFWRKPRHTPEPDERPDADVQLRQAQARLGQITFIASEHTRVTEEIAKRTQANHISEGIERWIKESPPPRTHHRRLPWSHA